MTTLRPLQLETLYICVSALTGIPAEELADAGSLLRRLPLIEATLRAHLIGQERAVEVAISALRARLLRQSATRPILNLLCVGPSGVGKTELARQLARVCLGNSDVLVRIDGSEFHEPHSLARLIGAPPGYIGHGPGYLTEAVRRRPRSVVLFDECEKAAPEVLNAFLQVMSAGRLTDAMGTTVDFRQTLVVLTSNLGNTPVGHHLPDPDSFEEQITGAVRHALRPELLGRLDATVVFHHLSPDAMQQIVYLKLDECAESLRMVETFDATPEAVEALAREAWSPDSGARQVDTVIQQRIDPAIAALLERGFLDSSRSVTVHIDYQQGDYVFECR